MSIDNENKHLHSKILRWDTYFMDIARRNAVMSYDPSSQIGAVIVRPDRTPASTGWNDYPRGLSNDPANYENRDYKLACILHAEENAILSAKEPLDGYSIYVSGLPPCAKCASMIIQKGIREVIFSCDAVPERWQENMLWSRNNMQAVGIHIRKAIES